MSTLWLKIMAAAALGLVLALQASAAPSTLRGIRRLDAVDSPYTVGLRATADGDNVCAGALIAPKFVLATHCSPLWYYNRDSKGLVSIDHFVSIGSNALSGSSDGERIKIDKLYPHPDYDMTTRKNEFFLLKLETESKFTPVAMAPATGAGIIFGSSGTAFGWGSDDAVGPTLQQAAMIFMNSLICSKKVLITETHLCAVTADNATETCKLEPGSPLYVNKKGATTLVGVLSFNNNCRQYLEPAVFSDVSSARAWIKTIAGV